MPTIRERDGKHQAIVRVKKGGVIVYSETKTFATDKLARSWGERVEARVKAEGVPQRQLSQKTLSDLLIEYQEALEAHGAIRRSRTHELLQLASEFDKVKLSEITAHTFSAFATRRRAAGTGPTTVLHNLATLRAVLNAAKPMFGYAVNGDAVKEAVAVLGRMGVTSKSKSRERRVSDEELQRLVKEFERIKPNPSTVIPMDIIVPLAVAWPRRLGELCAMTWADYNKRARTITLRDTKDPSKPRDEVVPLTSAGKRIIDALPVIDERILPFNSESVSAAFQRATKRLGMDDLHFHDLRHEGISRLFEQGLSTQEVALVSGHQSWAMLKRYTHPSVKALSEKLNAGLDEAQETSAEPARP